MADNKPTLDEGIAGPRVPAGFSGIRPFVMLYKPLIATLLIAGAAYFFTHPLTLHGAAQAGTMPGKVSAVDAGAIVAQPRVTLAPRPPARHFSPPPQVVGADLGTMPPQVAATNVGTANVPAAPVEPPPTSHPTESPAQVAVRERQVADRAALAAPLPAGNTAAAVVGPTGPKPQSPDANTAPPPFPFLSPATVVAVTLYSSIDSTVQTAGTGTLIGFVGRDVLDAYQRVVVIPRNSKVIGHLVSSQLQPGQTRVGAVWTGILLPNQHLISLTDAPGIDLTGTLGFGATIDSHMRKELANVLAFSVLAAGAQLAQPQQAANAFGYGSPSVGQSIGQSLGTQIQTMATNQYSRSSQIQPTAHVVEGAQVGIMLTNFMPMHAWDPAAQ